MTATLMIKYIKRTQTAEPDEVLHFEPGVNVLVGVPNTGKTKWLYMLDYLMGDIDTPESSFGADLAAKYDSLEALFVINDEEFVIQRRWKEYGKKHKLFINEKEIPSSDFSQFLLSKLNIPILHFPKGSPFSERNWPELSWRMLLRHIYRQQRFWSGGLASKQPDAEQYACLMQFLGLAEHLFSEEYGELVDKQKQIFKLQNMKDAFLSMLEELSKDLVEEQEVKVAITPDSIDTAIKRLNNEIANLQQQREHVLSSLLNQAVQGNNDEQNAFNQLSRTWNELQTIQEENNTRLIRIDKRLDELQDYREAVDRELEKLQRTQSAGRLLVDLKITHCPACDQTISRSHNDTEHCFLCYQSIDEVSNNSSTERIDFEAEQLKEEKAEIKDLINALVFDKETTIAEIRRIEEQIQRVNSQMKPVRQVASSIIPPEVTVLDMESGRLQERVRQLTRIKATLDLREKLSTDIDRIQAEVSDLKAQVEKLSKRVNLELASDRLTDGINTYLNALEAQGKNLWTQKSILFKIRKKDFVILVSNDDWEKKLGGTLTLYFLFAYHYALLDLIQYPNTHYPGLAILDLPPTLDDGTKRKKDDENFILEPFIQLVKKPGMEMTQVIVTGSSFDGLEGVNRIKLTQVWK